MPLLILRTLLDKKELSFEELVSILPQSRGTVNKYLAELFNQDFVARKGRRGKYYLSSKGKKEIKHRSAEKLQRDIDAAQKSYNEYMKNIIQLSQEGHAKILTKEEIKQTDFISPEGIPVKLDKEGANRLGISESHRFFIKGLQKVVQNLEKKHGLKAKIMVEGKKGKFAIGTEKKVKSEK